eukprot:COSAG01_NODE_1147_length_11515_cov_38.979694_9_plen_185_part_00
MPAAIAPLERPGSALCPATSSLAQADRVASPRRPRRPRCPRWCLEWAPSPTRLTLKIALHIIQTVVYYVYHPICLHNKTPHASAALPPLMRHRQARATRSHDTKTKICDTPAAPPPPPPPPSHRHPAALGPHRTELAPGSPRSPRRDHPWPPLLRQRPPRGSERLGVGHPAVGYPVRRAFFPFP